MNLILYYYTQIVPTHDISKIYLHDDRLLCCSLFDGSEEEHGHRTSKLLILSLNDHTAHKEGKFDANEFSPMKGICDLPIYPGSVVEQFLGVSICDFRWAGEKRDTHITIFVELTEQGSYPEKHFVAVWEVGMKDDKEFFLLRQRHPIRLPTPFFDLMPMAPSPVGVSPRILLSCEYRRNTPVTCGNEACQCHDGTRVEARTMHYNVGITDEDELIAYSNKLHELDSDQCENTDWNEWFDNDSSRHTVFVGSTSGDHIRITFPEVSYLGY